MTYGSYCTNENGPGTSLGIKKYFACFLSLQMTKKNYLSRNLQRLESVLATGFSLKPALIISGANHCRKQAWFRSVYSYHVTIPIPQKH